jgi:hypothetical protein
VLAGFRDEDAKNTASSDSRNDETAERALRDDALRGMGLGGKRESGKVENAGRFHRLTS